MVMARRLSARHGFGRDGQRPYPRCKERWRTAETDGYGTTDDWPTKPSSSCCVLFCRSAPSHTCGADEQGRGKPEREKGEQDGGRSMQVGEGSAMNPAAAFAEGGYPAAAAADGAATSDDDDGASTASGSSEGNATQEADEDESTADAPEEASAGTAGGANGGSSASDVVSGSDFMTDDGGDGEDRGDYAAKDTMGSYESATASERSGGPALLPSASRRSFYPPAPSDRQMRFMEEQLDAMDSEMSELSFGTAGAWGNESAARGPGVRYRHAASLLRGKRTRRALCTVIVAAVVVAVSTKLARMNKESHLPDWEKELADEQLVEESVAVAKHDKEVHDQIMKEEGGYKLDLPFGGSHVHGNAGNGQPSSSAGDIVNSVIQDAKANGGGEQSAASSQEQMGIPEISAEEAFVGQHYDPRWYDRNSGWAGATHSDAFDFCTSRRSVTCPYEAYCPGGVGRPPFGSSSGFLNDYLSLKEGSWAPTGNGDEWVQLSDQNDGVCRVSSMPGFGNGEQTGHLLCCKLAMPETGGGGTATAVAPESPPEAPVHNNGQTPPQGWIEVESQNRPEAAVDRGDEIKQELEAEASEADAARWHPVWFDRGSGWTGKTHGEADGFCDGQGGMIVCPYDADAYTFSRTPSHTLVQEVLHLDLSVCIPQSPGPVPGERAEWIRYPRSTRHSAVTAIPASIVDISLRSAICAFPASVPRKEAETAGGSGEKEKEEKTSCIE
ncbi:hypothetical protein THAOC_27864 [Thalassiosira oceanica]|uniref:DUF7495 domain-containing protein n=1 Tax=Thalassiosira oceanica TaxID=159749 RepID=K0S1Q5_THAOC|nr:hypothetical protein THAOC_27864 [Thalassiosira oceanica]|eukprot:EJK52827.1 hypothetical protein THAOC_27864 [Thalassiosira oceanica]